MMMRLSCVCAPMLRQELVCLPETGGMTESIFVGAERLLHSSSDYQKALEEIGVRKNMGKYRSLVDFLFVELRPAWRASCFRFYMSGKRPLRELLRSEQVVEFDGFLCVALHAAKAAWEQKLVKSWMQYRELVQELTDCG